MLKKSKVPYGEIPVMAHPTTEARDSFLSQARTKFESLGVGEMSDFFLERFLIAAKLNVETAFKSLENTLTWRRSLPKFEESEFEVLDASKKLFWHPNPAKDGRPILIWRSQYHYPLPSSAAATTSSNTTTSSLICSPSSSDRDSNYEVNLHIQWIAHTLETAKRDGVIKDKIHFILDRSETQQASATTTTSSFLSFATSSTSQSSNDLSLSRAIITTFASHYPEHLERVFVFPSSMMVSALWTLIKPFMDPVTQMRVMILGEKEVKAALDWFVGKDQLLVEYGGGFVDEDVKRFEIAGKEQDDVEKPESKPHHHHRRHHQHHRKKHPQTTNHSAIKYLDRTQPAVSNAPGRVPVDQIAATDSIAALAAEVASFQV